jgi:F0F1-type ATP synthase membrane subunit c/vacuolar-type H+-ATPase subunit K
VDLLSSVAWIVFMTQQRQVSSKALLAFTGLLAVVAASRCASRWLAARNAVPEARGRLRRMALISTVLAVSTVLATLIFLLPRLKF